MLATVDNIKAAVREILDEIGINDALFLGGSDQSNLDVIIASKIEDAIRHIYLVADEQFLEPSMKQQELDPTTSLSTGVARLSMELDGKFLRLVSAQADEWLYPVREYIPESDSRYPTLFNRYSTGTPERPKAGMRYSGGKRYLDLYGVTRKQFATVEYVLLPNTKETNFPVYDQCYRPILYYIAGLVLLTYKDEHADSLFNIALNEVGANIPQNQ